MEIRKLILCAALAALWAAPAGATDDFRDMAVIAGTINSALETRRTGTTMEWSNPTTGNAGEVTITRTYYQPDGKPCREYRRISRRKAAADNVVTGTGCRDDKAKWKLSEKADKTKSAATENKPPKPTVPDTGKTPDGWNDPAKPGEKPQGTETARAAPGPEPDQPETANPAAIAPPDIDVKPPKEAQPLPPPPRRKPLVVTGSTPSRSDD